MKNTQSKQGNVAVQVVVGIVAVGALVLSIAAIQSSKSVNEDLSPRVQTLEANASSLASLESDISKLKRDDNATLAALTQMSQDLQALKDQMAKKSEPKQTKKEVEETPTGPGTFHKIAAGDTLGKLAKQYGTSVEAIEKLNPGLDAKKLKLGKNVRVK